MSIDRVPIPTLPGMIGLFSDRAVLLPPTAGNVSGAKFDVTHAPSGGVLTFVLSNETGGLGGSGTTATISIADGEYTVSGAATIPLDATQTLYLSVTAESGTPMNLSGFIEFESVSTVYSALTSLERVKRELGIPVATTTNDLLLTDLINGVSARFTRATQRTIAEQTITAEQISGSKMSDALSLAEYPLTSTTPLELRTADGDVVDATVYRAHDASGLIYSVTGYGWTEGRLNYEADYSAGWATIPADIVAAVTAQVCHEYSQTVPGGARRGVSGRSGEQEGSETYLPGAMLPIFLETVGAYRKVA